MRDHPISHSGEKSTETQQIQELKNDFSIYMPITKDSKGVIIGDLEQADENKPSAIEKCGTGDEPTI